eukprot:TRINITY_DN2767_c0_g1_i1.p1 TRINITY_DN2767_c0_g1~~TRINITY_DN2767_c0_g1_i1.p1  ORF type:complete len:234 (-),score=30.86 TRINITY_DN2767_c0_g1_i1:356-1057(-)
MGVTVHGFVPSGSTASVLITLYEKDVTDYEFVNVDTFKGDQNDVQYLAKQPFGKIPVLEDGDLTLFESRAIVRYLADKYASQGPDLYPQNPKDRAIVEQWIEVESQCWAPPVIKIGSEAFYAPVLFGREGDKAVIAANLAEVGRVLDVLDDRLSMSKYLGGDFFSLADLVFLPTLFNLSAQLGELVESRKHVQAWWHAITGRPAFKKWEVEAQKSMPSLPKPKDSLASALPSS